MSEESEAAELSASTLVALATYNEIENLPSLVAAIHRELPDADVLVVDDNSPDGTGDWCADFARQSPWFTHHPRAGKLGLGSALAAAIQHGIEKGYQAVATLDADWSHPPENLPAMLSAAKSAEVVVGSRYCPGGRIEGWPQRRRILSKLMNFLTRLLVGLPLGDCSSNYRVYRTAALSKLDPQQLQSAGYAYLEEILWHLQQQGVGFAEVPITFTDRRAGESKINLGEMLGAAGTLLRLAWRRIF